MIAKTFRFNGKTYSTDGYVEYETLVIPELDDLYETEEDWNTLDEIKVNIEQQITDTYTKAYVARISQLVDGYTEKDDRKFSIPFCMKGLANNFDLDDIIEHAEKEATGDSIEYAQLLDEKTANDATSGTMLRISIIRNNSGVIDGDFQCIALTGKNFQQEYTRLVLECEQLTIENPSVYYLNIELQETYEKESYGFTIDNINYDTINDDILLIFDIVTPQGTYYAAGEWIENGIIETVESNIKFNCDIDHLFVDDFDIDEFMENLQTMVTIRGL